MARAYRSIFSFLGIFFLLGSFLSGQERKSTISGRATDTNHDALVGARVELQPSGFAVTTDAQGAFTISDLVPGKYTLNISYVGFKTFSTDVTVASGGTANVDPGRSDHEFAEHQHCGCRWPVAQRFARAR